MYFLSQLHLTIVESIACFNHQAENYLYLVIKIESYVFKEIFAAEFYFINPNCNGTNK